MIYRECFQHLGGIKRKRIVTAPNVRLRLNRGERPDPHFGSTQNVLANALFAWLNTIQQYPSYSDFYAKLAKHIGFPADQIVVGAGIEEFIRTLMFMCCEPGEKAAVLWPTCAMYDIYAAAFGVDLVRVMPYPGARWEWDGKHLVSLLEEFDPVGLRKLRVVFIPNPGQPVETCFNNDDLVDVVNWCAKRNILLVVDEAHHGFGAPTAFPLIDKWPNLLVMRTFSKFYGAASIRVGYVVGQRSLIVPIDALRPSGEISGPSMAIASALLDREDDLAEYAVNVGRARDALVARVNKLGLKAYGKYGFSVLIEFPSTEACEQVGKCLADLGVYVKTGFPGQISNCMLVACGGQATMDAFFNCLEQCWREVCVGQ